MIYSNLYVISAPSGAGKSSLIKALLKIKNNCNIKVSISYTTRAIRPGEIHGIHYYFISIIKFQNMIKENYFLEYAKVFGHYYGTSKREINNLLTTGFNVLLDIDWQGKKQIRKKIPEICSIFILPPSKKELNRRLFLRNQDNKIIIAKRMLQAVTEMKHYYKYDYLIINNNFNSALFDLSAIINAEQLSIKKQKLKYKQLINKLLNN